MSDEVPVQQYQDTLADMWRKLFAPPIPGPLRALIGKTKQDTSAVALLCDGRIPRRPLGYANVTITDTNGRRHRERLALYKEGPASESLLKVAASFTLDSIEGAR